MEVSICYLLYILLSWKPIWSPPKKKTWFPPHPTGRWQISMSSTPLLVGEGAYGRLSSSFSTSEPYFPDSRWCRLIGHVFRKANSTADKVATLGYHLQESDIITHPDFVSIVCKDAIGGRSSCVWLGQNLSLSKIKSKKNMETSMG